MLQNISITKNAVLLNFLFIREYWNLSTKNIKQHNCF